MNTNTFSLRFLISRLADFNFIIKKKYIKRERDKDVYPLIITFLRQKYNPDEKKVFAVYGERTTNYIKHGQNTQNISSFEKHLQQIGYVSCFVWFPHK